MIPPENIPLQSIAMFLVVTAVVALIGLQVVSAATSPETQAYMEESEEWCDNQNGTLVNSHAILHGGLHCDLPNGTSVHMSNVIEVNANTLEEQP